MNDYHEFSSKPMKNTIQISHTKLQIFQTKLQILKVNLFNSYSWGKNEYILYLPTKNDQRQKNYDFKIKK